MLVEMFRSLRLPRRTCEQISFSLQRARSGAAFRPLLTCPPVLVQHSLVGLSWDLSILVPTPWKNCLGGSVPSVCLCCRQGLDGCCLCFGRRPFPAALAFLSQWEVTIPGSGGKILESSEKRGRLSTAFTQGCGESCCGALVAGPAATASSKPLRLCSWQGGCSSFTHHSPILNRLS